MNDNIVVEHGYADWHAERLVGLVQEMLRRQVDVIICNGQQEAMVAAARATRTIPIVFYNAFAPVERGLIESFSRPGRNLTGLSMYAASEVVSKRLEFLKVLVPSATRLSWLWGHESLFLGTVDGGRISMEAMLGEPAKRLGFETRFHVLRGTRDIDAVLSEVTAWKSQGITASGWGSFAVRKTIADFALSNRLPSVFPESDYVDDGGLLSYGVPDSEYESLADRWTWYVDRVLRGARPASMPVEQPEHYELKINLKTARSLDLPIPQFLLARADSLIR